MSVPVNNASPSYALGQAQEHHHNPMKRLLEPAAKLLGLSSQQLRDELRSSKTLAELASDQGVSHDDLIAAVVVQGLQSGPPGFVHNVQRAEQTTDLAAIAAKLVDGKGFGGPPPPPTASGSDDVSQRLTALTDALGIDANTLFAQLESGTTLNDIASQHGVSSSTLSSILTGPVAVDTAA
jgi:hypothetical protein